MNIKFHWPYLLALIPVYVLTAFLAGSFDIETWSQATRAGAVVSYTLACLILWLHDEDL